MHKELIRLALTDKEILRCYPVMRELRPHIKEEDFVSVIREQHQSGYALAYLENDGVVVSVAGFRVGKNLAWGRFLYVDDLVSLASQRSKGHGKKMLGWLHEYAALSGCEQLHLDSGMQRNDAHRFYEREGMDKAGYHFVKGIAEFT